ncbi:MAG: hypothetical protein N4J56_004633 [Chroococcidiopsis sp. SAG 2025]|uniref:DUF3102 domain-containing protein n=1 Tax=Chroococcidiopsis sp. SAG 2025 TaxID=171389 RepID=UPI0029374324|nr:DUF3102 domain-containing protein [Chroococcidiopsis sp. SAG 2025]MDV2994979.1 hypothetical protein [Chroococcidiopsis sp. SAG 2025]
MELDFSIKGKVQYDTTSRAQAIQEAVMNGDRNLTNALECFKRAGQLLLEQKQDCKHGEFQKWVEDNCGFSYRSAKNYMELEQNWSLLSNVKEKGNGVALLSLRGALKLIRTSKHQEYKALNPSKNAVRKSEKYKKTPDNSPFENSPLQNSTVEAQAEVTVVEKEELALDTYEPNRFQPGFVGASREELVGYIRELESDLERVEADLYKLGAVVKQIPGEADIATLANLLKVKPKTKAQIKREEKKRKVALAPILPCPLEMGYENARLKAENARLKDEVERLKPVPINVDELGSREVKGLAQRLGLNQNLSTEETRELVREALANRDNLIKARQLLGQTEAEILKAKVAEQQEIIDLWQQSHQYYVGKGSFWLVLDASPIEPPDTIRAKYRRLIGFWHPDRNPLPVAHEITAQINRAWASYERNYITRKPA